MVTTTELAGLVRQIIFKESNNEAFWDSEGSKCADLTRGLAWLLGQDIYKARVGDTAATQSLESDQLANAKHRIVQNNVRLEALRVWGLALGFLWNADAPIIDPTGAISDELDRIFSGSSELTATQLQTRIAMIFPVLDGGRYRLELERALNPAKWAGPASQEILSTSLSRALWRLNDDGGLALEHRSDAGDVRVLQGAQWQAVDDFQSCADRQEGGMTGLANYWPDREKITNCIKREAEKALLAGNEEEAERLYEEILATGRLSLENRYYLRVRLLAGLGQWTELAAEAPLLRQLADLRLPPQVRGELLDALYRTHVAPVEDPRNAAAAVEEFRQKMAQFGRLFATRQGLRRPRVVKAFLMNALLRDQPQRGELEELAALLPMTAEDAPFSSALRALVELRLPPQRLAGLGEADAAFDDMDYDLALRLWTCPVFVERLGVGSV